MNHCSDVLYSLPKKKDKQQKASYMNINNSYDN